MPTDSLSIGQLLDILDSATKPEDIPPMTPEEEDLYSALFPDSKEN